MRQHGHSAPGRGADLIVAEDDSNLEMGTSTALSRGGWKWWSAVAVDVAVSSG